MSDDAAFIRLGDPGSAPVLSYDVPEPTTYSGTHYIELTLDADAFLPEASQVPTVDGKSIGAARRDLLKLPPEELSRHLAARTSAAVVAPGGRLPAARGTLDALAASPVTAGPTADGDTTRDGGVVLAQQLLEHGQRVVVRPTMWGHVPVVTQPPAVPRPRLVLVERYRLSSFLGDYGAGRVVSTFSLLPGEKTKISIRTYKKTEQEAKEASCILDSFTKESADEFATSTETQNTDSKTQHDSLAFHAEAEGEGNWGVASVKASAGMRSRTESAREEFARNTRNATEQHAARASAKRDVSINTSTAETTTTGEESTIERELANVNLSRTLNFVFRQMNQQFVTLLTLVDVRVAFHNGYAESTQVVPISQLDALLEDVIVPAQLDAVRDMVLAQYRTVRDRDGNEVAFLEQAPVSGDPDGYLRVARGLQATYTGETGRTYHAPGVLVEATENVLRTDGVIVESLLGEGNALDDHARGLQEQEVVAAQLANSERQAELDRLQTAMTIAQSGDDAAAQRFATVVAALRGPAPEPLHIDLDSGAATPAPS